MQSIDAASIEKQKTKRKIAGASSSLIIKHILDGPRGQCGDNFANAICYLTDMKMLPFTAKQKRQTQKKTLNYI